jgi:hypothetical protein
MENKMTQKSISLSESERFAYIAPLLSVALEEEIFQNPGVALRGFDVVERLAKELEARTQKLSLERKLSPEVAILMEHEVVEPFNEIQRQVDLIRNNGDYSPTCLGAYFSLFLLGYTIVNEQLVRYS